MSQSRPACDGLLGVSIGEEPKRRFRETAQNRKKKKRCFVLSGKPPCFSQMPGFVTARWWLLHLYCIGASKAVCFEETVLPLAPTLFGRTTFITPESTLNQLACEQASRLGTATTDCANQPFLRSLCITRNMPFYCARSCIVLESRVRDSHPSALAPRGCASGR